MKLVINTIKFLIISMLLIIAVLLLDKYMQSANMRYMYWRFYNGSELTQFSMLSLIMNNANAPEINKLNQHLVDQKSGVIFSKASSMAVLYIANNDYRFLPFVTNVLMNSEESYQRRMQMLAEVINRSVTNRHEWFSRMSSRTNDLFSERIKHIIETKEQE